MLYSYKQNAIRLKKLLPYITPQHNKILTTRIEPNPVTNHPKKPINSNPLSKILNEACDIAVQSNKNRNDAYKKQCIKNNTINK